MSAVLVRVAACMLLLTVGQLAAMRCWQYTWPGVVDWNSPIDNETTCEGKTEPCIEPFVLSMNSTEPNMTKLQELCESGGCPPELWCNTKGGESCVKYAFWTTDVTTNELKIVNYSRFCGSARSGNADTGVFSTVVNDGCYQQQINSFILERLGGDQRVPVRTAPPPPPPGAPSPAPTGVEVGFVRSSSQPANNSASRAEGLSVWEPRPAGRDGRPAEGAAARDQPDGVMRSSAHAGPLVHLPRVPPCELEEKFRKSKAFRYGRRKLVLKGGLRRPVLELVDRNGNDPDPPPSRPARSSGRHGRSRKSDKEARRAEQQSRKRAPPPRPPPPNLQAALAGDSLVLVRRVTADWLLCQVGDRHGLVPAHHVRETVPLPTSLSVSLPGAASPLPPAPGLSSSQSTSPESQPTSPDGPPAQGQRAMALYDFVPQEKYDLGFKAGDMLLVVGKLNNDWGYGSRRGVSGQFPLSYVDVEVENVPTI
ncbi:Endophilin-A2 [Amphibalanus amphitrite]|uniref:Endophilin-A2 n=1 Tax=Amphibalanus amphitrite TaxID=1232801 RepID=A0A6A4VMC8_AMPAM|nr:Endophilin-A2 [Amphibalanus amphitrite]